MAQRILEPGEIETLASRDVPRIILPDTASLFAGRADRLRSLAAHSAIGGYLQLLAALADAQQAQLEDLTPQQREELQAQARAQQSSAAAGAGMPLRPANTLQLDGCWRGWLRTLCQHCAEEAGLPAETRQELQRVAAADDGWLDAQAHAVLERDDAPSVDAVAALLVMNALQVYWAVLADSFRPTELKPLADAPGLCPLCGTLPVVSVVQARPPYASYRYLSCSLCACQWHYVRVQCSQCGAAGKDIAYRALADVDGDSGEAVRESAVRAETCDHCHSYRKILYLEKDPSLEPVADDLGTLALDLLLGEEGYARASQNPLLWQSDGE